MAVDPSKRGVFGRRTNGLPPCARPGLLTKLTADGFTSKTQEEGRSQKRALKKGWERPAFIVKQRRYIRELRKAGNGHCYLNRKPLKQTNKH